VGVRFALGRTAWILYYAEVEKVRKAAVSGMFYPDDPATLRADVEAYLRQAPQPGSPPVAAIVPHAGYVYSGTVAGAAYAVIRQQQTRYRHVLLMGPAHRVPLRGIAASCADIFETPLGAVRVDRERIDHLTSTVGVAVLEAAHQAEHCLEVQLPFLQLALNQFSIIPLLVGAVTPEDTAAVIGAAMSPETLLIISSDLSHYLPYTDAQALDRQTTRTIEQLAWQDLEHEQACGASAIQGCLYYAEQNQWKVRTVGLANSGDTAGGRDRVVGYGAYVFEHLSVQ
jgi:MEMO1 family protein